MHCKVDMNIFFFKFPHTVFCKSIMRQLLISLKGAVLAVIAW